MLIKNIKKVFAVCNYILQFHYKAHFNSSPNRFYQSSCHFLFRKVIKSGLEIIPFPPVSRILICFIGISLSLPFECSPYLHNLHCHPLPGDKHRLSFSLSFYRVSSHFGLFSFLSTCCLPWARTAGREQDADVPSPSLPSWPPFSKYQTQLLTPSPSGELASAHLKGTRVNTGATSFPKCKKSFCSQVQSVKSSEYLCAAWTILNVFQKQVKV